jgi:hypothetical protein
MFTSNQILQLFIFFIAKIFGILAVISIFAQQIRLGWAFVVIDFVIVTGLIVYILKNTKELSFEAIRK